MSLLRALFFRAGKIAISAGVLFLVIGCGSGQAPTEPTPPVLDTTKSVGASKDLLSAYTTLDGVYDRDMSQFSAKFLADEKAIVDDLTKGDKTAAKSLIDKDAKELSDGIAATNQTAMDSSHSTATNIGPMEHDTYVTYYTVVTQAASMRHEEYQAFLDFAKSPDETHRMSALQASRDKQGADLSYTEKKR